ncbi:hypothetical protein A33M_2577 [Rhodovulum sp. PH10]|nr:hypothetical protein A33M_2577 [Rhodovulum sp. PH10]
MIADAARDPARLRRLVYDLARLTLEREFERRFPAPTEAEVIDRFADLEAAISAIEASAEPAVPMGSVVTRTPDAKGISAVGPAGEFGRVVRLALAGLERTNLFLASSGWLGSSVARRVAELAVAAIVPLALYVLLSTPRVEPVAAPAETVRGPEVVVSAVPAAPAGPSSTLPFPLPEVYGIYAIQNDALTEIAPATTSPLDPRVRTVLQITSPGTVALPAKGLTFLVFRREMLASAPEKVPIRIAARLARMMTFDSSGKAVTAPPAEPRWVIRDIGFDFRVRPLKENQEMVLVQPEDPGFALPPGRYVLMINGAPYDFTVEGRVTDPAHCLESSATTRGTIVYECRVP